ncbi:MAG: SHOCT domain-containing protein [Defluviitaleaceae bacterium]|nr:SHOCT domain-containing protein [Defluviitaleaceae bacterium]
MKKFYMAIAWQLLFLYLAISKVLYWFDLVNDAGSFTVNIALDVLLPRILFRDLPLIVVLVIYYFIVYSLHKMHHEKQDTKHSKIIKQIALYAAGYVVVLAVRFLHFWILIWAGLVNLAELSWGDEFLSTTSAYLVVAIAMFVKESSAKFSAKKKKVVSKSAEDKIEMLEILLDDGILTQEEFETKKLRVLE